MILPGKNLFSIQVPGLKPMTAKMEEIKLDAWGPGARPKNDAKKTAIPAERKSITATKNLTTTLMTTLMRATFFLRVR